MNRRELLKAVPVLLVGMSLEGCPSFSAGADEFISILNLMSPAVSGIVTILDLVDPPIGLIVQAGVDIFNAEVPVVTKIYNDWKAASAAAAPSVIGQLEAGLATLKQDALTILQGAHVKDPAHQNAIDNLINSVLAEIAQVIGLVQTASAGGGTKVAATKAVAQKKSMGKPVTTAAQFRKTLKAQLNQKSGDAKLDQVKESIAAKLN